MLKQMRLEVRVLCVAMRTSCDSHQFIQCSRYQATFHLPPMISRVYNRYRLENSQQYHLVWYVDD